MNKIKSRLRNQDFYECIMFFISTQIIVFLSGIKLAYTAGWPDPFIYQGYAIDYSGLVARWGSTYFASRTPVIFLISLRENFHIDPQIFRSIIFGITCTVAFTFISKYFSHIKSALIVLVVYFNPWFLRHISDDYPAGFAVLFLTIFLTQYINATSSEKNKRKKHLLASGVFASLALISNYSLILILIPFFTAILILKIDKPIIVLKDAYIFLQGAGISALCILAFTNMADNLPFGASFYTAYNIIFKAQIDLHKMNTQPLSALAGLLVTLSIILFLTSFHVKKTINSRLVNSLILKKIFLITISIFLFGIMWHQIFGGAWFSWTWYLIYIASPIMLLVSFAVSSVNPSVKILPLLLIVELIFTRVFRSLKTDRFDSQLTSVARLLLILAAIVVAGLYLKSKKEIFASLLSVFLVFILFLGPLTQDNGNYFFKFEKKQYWSEYRDYIVSSRNDFQLDVTKLASAYGQAVKKYIPRDQPFWTLYTKEPSWLVSIESTQIYGYSCFKCTDNSGFQIDRTFPPFTQDDAEILKTRNYISIISSSRNELSRLTLSLKDILPNLKNVYTRKIDRDNTALYFSILMV